MSPKLPQQKWKTLLLLRVPPGYGALKHQIGSFPELTHEAFNCFVFGCFLFFFLCFPPLRRRWVFFGASQPNMFFYFCFWFCFVVEGIESAYKWLYEFHFFIIFSQNNIWEATLKSKIISKHAQMSNIYSIMWTVLKAPILISSPLSLYNWSCLYRAPPQKFCLVHLLVEDCYVWLLLGRCVLHWLSLCQRCSTEKLHLIQITACPQPFDRQVRCLSHSKGCKICIRWAASVLHLGIIGWSNPPNFNPSREAMGTIFYSLW